MLRDVVEATYLDNHRLKLTFDDGHSGVVDFAKYVRKGGVFARLRDLTFFRTFSVNRDIGTVTWGDEVDVAPETLYAEATGSSLPEWVEVQSKADGDAKPMANKALHADGNTLPVSQSK